MSLLILSRAFTNKDSDYKSTGVFTGQVMFACEPGKYHTPWLDMATYSAIVDLYGTSRCVYRWRKVGLTDDWGRIKRTELWG